MDAAAEKQVLTRSQLHMLGVTQRMIAARIRHGGPWRRLLPGVIMLRNGTPTRAQSIDAALRYAGDGAVVTGITAARLHGLTRHPATNDVHVLIPAERKRSSTGFVMVERTTRRPRVVVRDGFPTADVTRAVMDATRRMSDRAAVEELLAEAVQRGRTSPRLLRRELDEGPMWGTARPRSALVAIGEGARSTAEVRAVALSKRSGLPAMQWNVSLRSATGLLLPRPDGWLDEVGLAWEIDSFAYHLSPADYRRTLWRHNVLTGHGIVVVHTLPTQLTDEPEVVIRELRDAYREACRRPRPAVEMCS